MKLDYDLIVQEVRRTGAKEQEDLVQDVVVKLLENKPKDANRAYIRKLVRNTLLNKVRTESRRPKLVYDNVDHGYEPMLEEQYDCLYTRDEREEESRSYSTSRNAPYVRPIRKGHV